MATFGFGAANKSFGFGATTSAAPAFGTSTGTTGAGLSFGSGQAATTTSGSGFSFGANTSTQPQQQTGFNFGSNKPATTAAPGGFGFGSNANTGFGTGASTGFGTGTNTAFGTGTNTGFGTGTSSAFGAGTNTGFGTNTSTGFGTGAGTAFGTSTNTGFGTGTGSAFGTGTGTAFGGGTNTGFGTGTGTAFGTGTTFGTNTGFGTNNAGGGLFGGSLKTTQPALGFGPGSNTFKGFGQPQPQQQQQQQQQQAGGLCPSVALYLAVCAPAYFNDERDEVLKKWNQLQAVWGSGKGYYAPGLPPVDFTPDNEFCRFKAVGYIKMPTFSAEEGLVELVIAKKDTIVREQQAGLVGELCKVYGGAVQVCVEYVKPGPGDSKTRLCYYVQHRSPNGETKKANTWDVYNHLKSDQHRQTVTNLCIESATPLVSLTEAQLKDYLDKPPRGLDPGLWEQGKRANPDPSKFLPVPLVGFQELQARFRAQETESSLLQGQLDKIAEDVCSVQGRQAALLDQLAECNRKQRQTAHRVLQLVVRQECNRKRGVPVGGAEEQLRIRLETLHAQLQAPTQYMGKVNELLSQVSGQGLGNGGDRPPQKLSPETETDVRELLAWQQDGISEVVAVLKSDMKTFDSMLAGRGK